MRAEPSLAVLLALTALVGLAHAGILSLAPDLARTLSAVHEGEKAFFAALGDAGRLAAMGSSSDAEFVSALASDGLPPEALRAFRLFEARARLELRERVLAGLLERLVADPAPAHVVSALADVRARLGRIGAQVPFVLAFFCGNLELLPLVEPLLRTDELFVMGANAFAEQLWDDSVRLMLAHESRLDASVNALAASLSLPDELAPPVLDAAEDPFDHAVAFSFSHAMLRPAGATVVAARYFVREQYNFLQAAAARSGRLELAVEAAEAFLAIAPAEQTMRVTHADYVRRLDGYVHNGQRLNPARPSARVLALARVAPVAANTMDMATSGHKTSAGTDGGELTIPTRDVSEFNGQVDPNARARAMHDRAIARLVERLGVRLPDDLVAAARVRAHARALEARVDDLARALHCARGACAPVRASAGLVVDAASLSYREFFSQFSVGQLPVLLAGGASRMTTVPWTWAHLRNVCGAKTFSPAFYRPGQSQQWASLEHSEVWPVERLLDALEHGAFADQAAAPDQLPYLFDWSLPAECPELLSTFVVPRFFAGDLFQRTPRHESLDYRDSWPSLFVGPAGSRSGLHVDALGTSFWMGLIRGTKRWVLFPRDARGLDASTLLRYRAERMSSDLDALARELNASAAPALAHSRPVELIQRAGDLVFIPGGTPHQVENLEDVIGVSMNFVDGANVARVRDALRIEASAGDESSAALLAAMSDPDLVTAMSSEPRDTPFKTFKFWPRTGEMRSLSLDAHGRARDGAPYLESADWLAPVTAHASVLPAPLLDAMRALAPLVYNAELRAAVLPRDSPVTQNTFWLSAADGPASAAHVVMRRVARTLGFAPGSYAGAEMWFQERPAGDPLHFHVDCEEARHGVENFITPLRGTVVYLNAVGGPTAFFDATVSGSAERPAVPELQPSAPTAGALVWPHANQLASFRGNMLHGVFAPTGLLPADATLVRQTMLLNFWSIRPTGLVRLERALLVELASTNETFAAALLCADERDRGVSLLELDALPLDARAHVGVVAPANTAVTLDIALDAMRFEAKVGVRVPELTRPNSDPLVLFGGLPPAAQVHRADEL